MKITFRRKRFTVTMTPTDLVAFREILDVAVRQRKTQPISWLMRDKKTVKLLDRLAGFVDGATGHAAYSAEEETKLTEEYRFSREQGTRRSFSAAVRHEPHRGGAHRLLGSQARAQVAGEEPLHERALQEGASLRRGEGLFLGGPLGEARARHARRRARALRLHVPRPQGRVALPRARPWSTGPVGVQTALRAKWPSARFVILAGQDYARCAHGYDSIVVGGRRHDRCNPLDSVEPLQFMQIGDRLAWLTRETDELEAARLTIGPMGLVRS